MATIPPDKLGVPEQAILRRTGDDSSRCAALYDGKQIVVTRQSEDLSGDKTRNADRSRPGHSRAGDGDCPRSQRHDALCRNRQRVDPVVAVERRAGGRSRHRAAVAGEAGHYLAGTDARRRDARGGRRRRRSDQLVLRDAGVRIAEEARGEQAEHEERGQEADLYPLAGPRMGRPFAKSFPRRAIAPCWCATRRDVATMDYTTSQRQLLTLARRCEDRLRVARRRGRGTRGRPAQGLAHRGQPLRTAARPACIPEVSWSSLWGRVWYEGLNAPEFSWQSTAAPTTTSRS